MLLFVGLLALVLLQVVLHECDVIASGTLAGGVESEFIATVGMEICTLSSAFLALRLFKFPKIHAQLVSQKAPALLKWGSLRLALLEVPMLSNTLSYYIYMKPTFGYLAIMLALCLPFVIPTMSRCLAETSEE